MKRTQVQTRLGRVRTAKARVEPHEGEMGEPLPSIEMGATLREANVVASDYHGEVRDPLPEIEKGVAVEKYQAPAYYSHPMGGKEARLRRVADDYGLPVEVLRTLIDDWKATGRITQREPGADAGADTRAEVEPGTPPASPLPAAPAAATEVEIREPRPQWKDHKDKMALPEFVAWAYARERQTGTLSKATLRGDFDLYTDYFNWRRRRNLPTEQHWLRELPTKKQWAAQQPDPGPTRLEEFDETTQQAVRRYQRFRQRGYRRAHSAG